LPATQIKKLVIFGVGLIGGSFALALRQAGVVKHITGIGRSNDNLDEAKRAGVIDEAGKDIASAVKDADLIMLATPVGQMSTIMQKIAPHLSEKTIITDAGSTKQDVVTFARARLAKNLAQFVPGHPIAGAEQSGVSAAKTDLFNGKNVVLTPLTETQSSAVDTVENLWKACGANIAKMDPAQHDEVFATVSHLPHILAFALVDYICNKANADELFKFAASGFRDFTRIASSHPEMWRDIALANRAALLDELEDYQSELNHIKKLLQSSDAQGLEELFKRARTARNDWLKSKS
jgi:prephenate dehydrogenase